MPSWSEEIQNKRQQMELQRQISMETEGNMFFTQSDLHGLRSANPAKIANRKISPSSWSDGSWEVVHTGDDYVDYPDERSSMRVRDRKRQKGKSRGSAASQGALSNKSARNAHSQASATSAASNGRGKGKRRRSRQGGR